jgi:hypothetical protein
MPGAAFDAICREIAACPADQDDVAAGGRRGAVKVPGDAGVHVPGVQEGATPRAGHFQQEKPRLLRGGGLERLTAHPRGGGAAQRG